jgi:hypothetical protein
MDVGSEAACLAERCVDGLKLALSRMVKRNIDVEVDGWNKNPQRRSIGDAERKGVRRRDEAKSVFKPISESRMAS